jgi:hypothetical protein
MAIRNVNDGVSAWNNKMPFPKDNYVIRCLEEKFAPSSSGNPMITRNWEVVSPEVATLGDKQVSVVGARVTQWLPTEVYEGGKLDEAKSDKAFGKVRDDFQALGYKDTSIDTANPPLIAKGKCAYGIVYARENEATKPLTNQQRLEGKKVGDAIIDPTTGKPVITYQLQIECILGLAPEPAL